MPSPARTEGACRENRVFGVASTEGRARNGLYSGQVDTPIGIIRGPRLGCALTMERQELLNLHRESSTLAGAASAVTCIQLRAPGVAGSMRV